MRTNLAAAFLASALDFDGGRQPDLGRWVQHLDASARSARDPRRKGTAPDEPPSDATDAVRLLTIHGAKGLEAPVVFLAQTARKSNESDVDWSVHWPIETSPAAPQQFFMARGKEHRPLKVRELLAERAVESMRESWNLLYVAMTRARQVLIVTGATGAHAAPDLDTPMWVIRPDPGCCPSEADWTAWKTREAEQEAQKKAAEKPQAEGKASKPSASKSKLPDGPTPASWKKDLPPASKKEYAWLLACWQGLDPVRLSVDASYLGGVSLPGADTFPDSLDAANQPERRWLGWGNWQDALRQIEGTGSPETTASLPEKAAPVLYSKPFTPIPLVIGTDNRSDASIDDLLPNPYAQRLGLALHGLMDSLTTYPPLTETAIRTRLAHVLPRRASQFEDVDTETGESAFTDTEYSDWLATVHRVLKESALARFFDPAHYRKAWNELPLQTPEGHRIVDRLVDDGSTLWILDYKSDAETSPDVLRKRHGSQVRAYAGHVASAYGYLGRQLAARIVSLHDGSLVEIAL